jgi:hypothetical protein
MMLTRRACSVAFAFAVAGLAGCSGGHGPAALPVLLGPNAYAVDVTTAGRLRWQAPLAGPLLGSRLSPLAVGAVAVFAQGDFLYGLRLADGHQVWSRAIGQPIAGMWRWRALVIVRTLATLGLQPGRG